MSTALISSIIGILVSVVKWIIDRQAGKKLSDAEFLKHIEAHQERRKNVSNQAIEFEENINELRDQIKRDTFDAPENGVEENSKKNGRKS